MRGVTAVNTQDISYTENRDLTEKVHSCTNKVPFIIER